ncbi:hypothetical protein J8J40_34525, partial [Mycobacterium tuberculosis]|nr:hypothetical protein [Mycobacterium tuberculosis]
QWHPSAPPPFPAAPADGTTAAALPTQVAFAHQSGTSPLPAVPVAALRSVPRSAGVGDPRPVARHIARQVTRHVA